MAVAVLAMAMGSAAYGQCTYSLVNSSGYPIVAEDIGYLGGLGGAINVSTASGCSWSATTTTSWITITAGSTGSGAGTVNFSVGLNQGGSRTGSLVIQGQTLAITQVAFLGPSAIVTEMVVSKSSGAQGSVCGSNVPAPSLVFAPTDAEAYAYTIINDLNVGDVVTEQYYAPNGTLYSGAGGSFTSTSNGGFQGLCDLPSTGLKIFGNPPATMAGTWNVNIYVTSATDPNHTPVLIITVPFAITGSTSCSYMLSGNTTSFNGSGGSGSIAVTASQGCPWSAATISTWIHIASSGISGTGSGTVSYTVDANNGAARSGAITIQGQAFTVTQAAAGPAGPTITQGGVAEPWTNSAGLAPGSWVSIYGGNLSSSTLSWAPVAGQPLPTTVGGVSVSIDGQPAPVSFVSPGQLNVLVPAAVRLGPIQIIVNNNGNTSNGYSVQSTTYLPAIYARAAAGTSPQRYYVTAVDPVSGQIVGNFSADPSAVHAPRAGETIDLYGLGLGPTTPQFPTSTAFSGSFSLTSNVTVTLGGTQLTPLFAGLVGPGLYQVRITIPSTIALGDQAIQLSVGGVASPQNVFLSIGQ